MTIWQIAIVLYLPLCVAGILALYLIWESIIAVIAHPLDQFRKAIWNLNLQLERYLNRGLQLLIEARAIVGVAALVLTAPYLEGMFHWISGLDRGEQVRLLSGAFAILSAIGGAIVLVWTTNKKIASERKLHDAKLEAAEANRAQQEKAAIKEQNKAVKAIIHSLRWEIKNNKDVLKKIETKKHYWRAHQLTTAVSDILGPKLGELSADKTYSNQNANTVYLTTANIKAIRSYALSKNHFSDDEAEQIDKLIEEAETSSESAIKYLDEMINDKPWEALLKKIAFWSSPISSLATISSWKQIFSKLV